MSGRRVKIYTGTGDGGETGLSGGRRVRKDCLLVRAIGDVDELNCVLGMVLAQDVPDHLREILLWIQHRLFDVGAELNCEKLNLVTEEMITQLERHIDACDEQLPPLKNFILPGGDGAASACHVARAVCRRAERSVVALSERQEVNPAIRVYLNRLSDLLFVVSRQLSGRVGRPETLWMGRRK